jgi:hypothetical protein
LTFKDAPEFTPSRKQIIVQDISEMHDFFASLGISTPDTLPPFTAKDNFGTFTPPLEYRGELIIPRSAVNDRRVATHIYADYVIQKAVPWKQGGFYDVFRDPSDPTLNSHLTLLIVFHAGLRDYFQASFWNVDPPSSQPLSHQLWFIRASLGKKFTDRLGASVLRILADSPEELVDEDMNESFSKALKIADGILEANQQSWPTIQNILDHNKTTFEMEHELVQTPHN